MKFFRFCHRWIGVISAFFMFLFALTGIILNHRSTFAPVDVNRSLLPSPYTYKNWNLAAIKGGLKLNEDSLLIYGNIGIWVTDSSFSKFTDFSTGFPKGIDRKKIFRIQKSEEGVLYAAALSGLWVRENEVWEQLILPSKSQRLTSLILRDNKVYALSRSEVFVSEAAPGRYNWERIQLKAPEGYSNKVSLFKTLWLIHSGEILGGAGKLFVDLMGLALIALCITGFIWFLAPDLMKRLKRKSLFKNWLVKTNRFSFKWHNLIGIWTALFLIIIAFTGIFLRPPLLIAIAQSRVHAIPGTVLAHSNPWHDKLRDIQSDRRDSIFIFSTSDGFFVTDYEFQVTPVKITNAPPVSVMNINVFEQPEDGYYIVGSFSGIFRWVPSSGFVQDMITGEQVKTSGRGMANPFGAIAVAGYVETSPGSAYLFDYNSGAMPYRHNNSMPAMTEEIIKKSGMSLWNLSLEVHTGRFYSFFMGRWYILFIPLSGLGLMVIVVTGVILWFRKQRRKKHDSKKDLTNGTESEPTA